MQGQPVPHFGSKIAASKMRNGLASTYTVYSSAILLGRKIYLISINVDSLAQLIFSTQINIAMNFGLIIIA
jgi:hypothetical protein